MIVKYKRYVFNRKYSKGDTIMRINKTVKGVIAGFLSALMLLTPAAVYADNGGETLGETGYAAYDDAAASDHAWVTPVTSAVTPESAEPGGHVGIPYELPEYQRDPLETVSAEVSQPFYYAIGEGIGTYAKDQGQWGTCWAFSATGAAESSILANGGTFNKGTEATASNIDLSELHTAYFFYNTESDPLGNMQNDKTAIVGYTYLTGGGNNMLTSFALMAWKGMALESTCPYGSITGQYQPGPCAQGSRSLPQHVLGEYERYPAHQGNDHQIRRSHRFL